MKLAEMGFREAMATLDVTELKAWLALQEPLAPPEQTDSPKPK